MFRLLVVSAFIGLATSSLVSAETLVQSLVDSRIALAFRVNQDELQRWIPAPWQVNAPSTGPSKDANLMVTFVDRVLDQDAEGKPVGVPTYRIVALSVPVKNPQTGDTSPLSIRIFNSNPQGVPGFYKTAVQATITKEQTLKGVGVEPGTGTERWEMRDPRGGLIDFRVQYTRGTPARAKSEAKPRSGVDPTIWRIYRADTTMDVVRSVPASIDRVKSYKFRVTVPELAKLFDGSEQLVSIAAIPSYTRQTFLP